MTTNSKLLTTEPKTKQKHNIICVVAIVLYIMHRYNRTTGRVNGFVLSLEELKIHCSGNFSFQTVVYEETYKNSPTSFFTCALEIRQFSCEDEDCK